MKVQNAWWVFVSSTPQSAMGELLPREMSSSKTLSVVRVLAGWDHSRSGVRTVLSGTKNTGAAGRRLLLQPHLNVICLLFVIYCLLFFVYCLLFVVWCFLFFVFCFLFFVCCLFFVNVICCLLFAVPWLQCQLSPSLSSSCTPGPPPNSKLYISFHTAI